MFRRYRIEGHSMEPRYKRGSSVLVWKTKRIRVGDVVAFTHSGRVLIKRINKQSRKDTFKVKGDNKADSLDVGPIRAEQIIGRVVLSY